ncbi:MAG: hypothetical protein ACD_72C00063G0002 [uncultured bacterium]|nr:MAG: hypothetical protein ACD_72C00063G0002 [uncultured bacterium]
MHHAGRALIDPFKILEKIKLQEGMRVADMGCGRTGHFVFPAARIVGPRGMVYAVDILKDVLENINSWVRSQSHDNIQTIWSDIEMVDKTPIPAKSLDACFFMNVLSALKNRNGALSEAARLLKDDGSVVVIDWQKKLATLGPSDEAMLSPLKLTELAKESGLRLIESYPVSEYHYCSIFKKS